MSIVKKLKNISCKEYCNLQNFKYSVIQKELPQKVYVPNYGDTPENINSIDVKFPEIYTAELADVNLVGLNYIIFDNKDYCIYDLPFMDYENKFDLRCSKTFYIDRDSTFIEYEPSSEVIEEGIMLISGCANNYSHFQFEVVSKLCLINEMKEYNNVPIIVDEICLIIPQFAEELAMLNKQGRKIIPLKDGYGYNVKKLIVISDLGVYPCNIKPGFLLKYEDVLLSDLCIKLLNKNLSIKNSISKKLFVSRSKSPVCRLQNQAAVENIFKGFGYEIIFPGEMSFQDQLKIFSEAEFIAGESGSGLTNIIFANKNAKVTFIQPKTVQSPWYSNIAGILNLKSCFLDGNLSDVSNLRYYQSGFILNEDYLRNYLSRLV